MSPYAQTNFQLFNQLRRDGYSNAELSCVRDAYEFAMRLFAGQFRPSKKPFIDHLVGTASILGSLRVPVELVAAGLLHATYTDGDFGGSLRLSLSAKRKQIRRAVGEKVEERVFRYVALRCNSKTRLSLIRNNLNALDREVLLMRLANNLEDCLDLGVLFCCNWESRKQHIVRSGHMMVEMAETLGFPALATEMARAFKETVEAEIPSALQNRSGPARAFVLAPRSYYKRPSAALSDQLARGRKRLFRDAKRTIGVLIGRH